MQPCPVPTLLVRRMSSEVPVESPAHPHQAVSAVPADLTPQCVHCGLCLQACPTYIELGKEADSPRGRIYLMQARQQGRLPVAGSFAEHISACLDCRACESACPSGVPYGELVEQAREVVEQQLKRPLLVKALRRYVFGWVFPSPRILRFHFHLLRLYQRLGLQALVRGLAALKLIPSRLAGMERLLPDLRGRAAPVELGAVFKSTATTRFRVGLVAGCVMNEVFAGIHRATIRVLQRNGCEIVVPSSQVCCAALHAHAGITATAHEMAKRNIQAFEQAGVTAVIVNAAGCGAKLKEYGALLAHDPEFSSRARDFSQRVVDISEFLDGLPALSPPGRLELRVAYDDPCHLLHAQRIAQAPRRLLQQIPGLKLLELQYPDQCCGSAGIYNITHPELSRRILERKVEDIKQCGPAVVATGNPGCLLQIANGLRMAHLHHIQVMHPLEILDRAYRSAYSENGRNPD